MRILIDPGHGGDNTGCEYNGVMEKVFTLQLGALLERCLAQAGQAVFMTRVTDTEVSLPARGAWGAKIQADLVISLHADGNADPAVGFLSSYCLPEDSVGRAVGDEIERAAPNALRPKTPDTTLVRPSDWTNRAYNCLHNHAPRPAILVECGFLSNPRHAAYLKTAYGRAAVAAAIMLGIAKGNELIGGNGDTRLAS